MMVEVSVPSVASSYNNKSSISGVNSLVRGGVGRGHDASLESFGSRPEYRELINKGYEFKSNSSSEEALRQRNSFQERGFEVEIHSQAFNSLGILMPGKQAIFARRKTN